MIRVSHAFIFNQILTKYSSERNTYSLYDYTYEILLYLILLLNKKKDIRICCLKHSSMRVAL